MIRLATATVLATLLASGAAPAQETEAAAARADIQATFGMTPSFIGSIDPATLPGLWQMTKALQFSGDTALDAKTKALISLGVAAQIPCTYCIWMDTATARQNGATDREISEAIAVAGQARMWSTIFHGLQLDLGEFKKEFGGS